NDRIRDDVKEKVTRMWSKKREQDTVSEVFTDERKRKTMDGMLKGRVSTGMNDRAVGRVKAGCDDTVTFKKCNLTTIVDTGARQSLYSESPQANIAEAANYGDPGNSTATMDAGLIEEANDDMYEFPQMDEEELGTVIEAEAKAREQKRLKTVTVRLQDTVREELLKGNIDSESLDESSKNLEGGSTDYNKMVRMLSKTQEF
ncbi:hypothetical protein BGZ95_008229, partial [Linnemannia exigua]